MTPFLIVLGLTLFFEGGQCQELEVFVAEGSEAVLPCMDETSALSHPTAVYWSRRVENAMKTIWRREKSGLVFRALRHTPRAHCPIPNFGKDDYSLHIDGTRYEDAGQYVCEVNGKAQKITKVVMLRVIKVSFSPSVVIEGSKTEAKCHVSPGTQLVMTNWKRNDTPIQRMNLNHVTQKDAGEWTCVVSYNNGVAEATGSLQVRGISSPRDNSSVLYAAVGSSVSLPCIFTDGLIPNTVSWKRTSIDIKSPSLLPKSFNWSSVSATIQSVEDGNEGMYSCSGFMEGLNANNIKVQRTMELVVARVLRSSSSSGDGTVTLTCHLSNSSQITSYEWLLVTYGPNDTQIVTSVQKTESFKIKQLSEKDAGEWLCRFYGSQGLLGNVTYQLHMMGAVKSEKSSGNKSALMIGLGFLFVVMFLILFQMYRNNRRRKKALLYPAMETIVHQAATDREWRERREQNAGKMVEACVGEPKPVCV